MSYNTQTTECITSSSLSSPYREAERERQRERGEKRKREQMREAYSSVYQTSTLYRQEIGWQGKEDIYSDREEKLERAFSFSFH